MEVKDAKSVQRAYRKVQRTGEALAVAKDDNEIIDAIEKHEKAKTAYGRTLKKVSENGNASAK